MPPFKKKQKRAEDKRSPEEIAIESVKNSSYNICIPMYNAEFIRMRNPLDVDRDKTFKTSSLEFLEFYLYLSNKGLAEKLDNELKFFADNYDSKWNEVIDRVKNYTLSIQEPLTSDGISQDPNAISQN
jgi:hypothetical protein